MSEELEKAKAEKREHPAVKVLGWGVTAVCLVWLGWMARALAPQKPAGGPPPMAAMMGGAGGPPPVEVRTVGEAALNPPEAYIGRVEPIQDVELRAQIDGYVKQVHFREGALVRAGDLLFTIDPEQYEARVAVRKAEIGQAEAALDRAERYLRRLEQSDARAITQTDLDTARSDVAQGRAAVKQAVANLALAEIDLKHTRMTAPIGGRIGRTVANVGDYVAPSLGPLVRIVQTDPIRVAFSVTDKDYLRAIERHGTERVRDALRIRYRLPTGTVSDTVGARDFEDNTMSADTATLSVRARFPNARGLLVPDGYVTVLVDLADAPKLPVVPQEALLTDREGSFVYVVDDAEVAQRRPVSTGAMADGRVAVRSGVKPGERVVVQGVQKVIPGQPVKVAAAKEAPRK
ncbi:MAG: efflux RND transporter periplasmic adaptor subunit [Kiritimatiellia bacterium]|jgi:membrane fusion protein (multidrug efflux system)|nr:efflux RND transporter periplasmic adaptor subunit [Kiritimatiellia bacterium]